MKEGAKNSIKEEQEKQAAAKERIKKMDAEGIPYCPKCKSESLSAEKRGFKLGRALVFAPAGFIGRKKIELHCLNCGNKFKASLK
ncbi:hypothetical protein ACM26V_00520 [Salipaludibacillus sp. HK11]|uniref:hypothetical protein n=1 Tax=Salipaludibacillus sp. HK11 TaxID=3394320 RepID=UPI0039FC5953